MKSRFRNKKNLSQVKLNIKTKRKVYKINATLRYRSSSKKKMSSKENKKSNIRRIGI